MGHGKIDQVTTRKKSQQIYRQHRGLCTFSIDALYPFPQWCIGLRACEWIFNVSHKRCQHHNCNHPHLLPIGTLAGGGWGFHAWGQNLGPNGRTMQMQMQLQCVLHFYSCSIIQFDKQGSAEMFAQWKSGDALLWWKRQQKMERNENGGVKFIDHTDCVLVDIAIINIDQWTRSRNRNKILTCAVIIIMQSWHVFHKTKFRDCLKIRMLTEKSLNYKLSCRYT